MSKAGKQKVSSSNEPPLILKVREQVDTGQGGSRSEELLSEKCWDFHLVNTTPEIARLENEAIVRGLIISNRIAITASLGLLGFVPADQAKKVLEAIKLQGKSILKGKIISLDREHSRIYVDLCLN